MTILDELHDRSRNALLRDLDLYRAIQMKMGSINRPNFEDGTKELVRRKYVPNKGHEAFYRANPIGRGKWLCGGNRSGKTETGIREDVSFALGFRPHFRRDDPDFFTPLPPPTSGRIVCEDWEKAAKGTIVPKLLSVIPPELLKHVKKNQMGVEFYFEVNIPYDATRRYSSLEIVTNKADPRSLEGWRGDYVHFDEPPRKAVFTALTRGLVDTNGWFWMTLTPLSEPWILTDVVLRTDRYDGNYIDVYDNIYNPETGSGFLTEEGIENFAAKLTEIEKRSRIHGEFAHLSGRILDEFIPRVHIYPNDTIKMEGEPPKTWWRDVFIDPAKRKPHCVMFAAWSPKGDAYIYDGFRIGNPKYSGDFNDVIQGVPTVTELAGEIRKRCGVWPQRFFIDPLADTPDWDTGMSLIDQLMDEFPMEKWPKVDKESAILPLRELMYVHPETGKTRFHINQKMLRAIAEIEWYRWDEYRGNEARDYKAKVIKKGR